MTKLQRVKEVLLGLFMFLGSLIMILLPEDGFIFVAFILGLTLLFRGIKKFLFYFSMARHMVGGKINLYTGVIMLDAGLFALTLTDFPPIYVMLYLLCCHAFSGVVDMLRAIEARSFDGRWKMNMFYGIVNLLIAMLSLIGGFSSRSIEVVVYIYCAGLIYSSAVHVAKAFRKSAIVYIQ